MVLEARRNLVEARIQQMVMRSMQAKARVALQYFEHDGGHP
jgi:hypothetical protein